MRKVALVLGALLALSAPVAAADAAPQDKPVQLALFQQKNIFHSGLTHDHTIALTFDDGPNAHTNEVLDALKALHVKATFFIVGQHGPSPSRRAGAHRRAKDICSPTTAPPMPSWARAMTQIPKR